MAHAVRPSVTELRKIILPKYVAGIGAPSSRRARAQPELGWIGKVPLSGAALTCIQGAYFHEMNRWSDFLRTAYVRYFRKPRCDTYYIIIYYLNEGLTGNSCRKTHMNSCRLLPISIGRIFQRERALICSPAGFGSKAFDLTGDEAGIQGRPAGY